VWGAVAVLALVVASDALIPWIPSLSPRPTAQSVLDEHQDCGSGGDDYAALEDCLIARYGWPREVAERLSGALRYGHARDAWQPRPTDWNLFRRYAVDLRSVYRARGVRDLTDLEVDIEADSATRVYEDSIGAALRDSTERAYRLRASATDD
jgi:hypothetical protein